MAEKPSEASEGPCISPVRGDWLAAKARGEESAWEEALLGRESAGGGARGRGGTTEEGEAELRVPRAERGVAAKAIELCPYEEEQ